jgi:hypothetical protein
LGYRRAAVCSCSRSRLKSARLDLPSHREGHAEGAQDRVRHHPLPFNAPSAPASAPGAKVTVQIGVRALFRFSALTRRFECGCDDDTHARDQSHPSRKAKHFSRLKPVRKGASWSAPVNPPKGGTSPQIMPWRDHVSAPADRRPHPSPARNMVAAYRSFLTSRWRPGLRDVLSRGRAERRAAMRTYAPSFRQVVPLPSLMRGPLCDR